MTEIKIKNIHEVKKDSGGDLVTGDKIYPVTHENAVICSDGVKVGTKLNGIAQKVGELTSLTTTEKSSLVGAINEVNDKPSGGGDNLTLIKTITGVADTAIVENLGNSYREVFVEIRRPSTPTATSGVMSIQLFYENGNQSYVAGLVSSNTSPSKANIIIFNCNIKGSVAYGNNYYNTNANDGCIRLNGSGFATFSIITKLQLNIPKGQVFGGETIKIYAR